MSDAVAAAQADADKAWGDHDTARAPLRDELLATLTSLEGVTGLQAGPGSERLADAFLDFGEFHADELAAAQAARAAALAAQDARDTAAAAEPPAPATVEPSMLETAEPLEIREWLKTANDGDVLAVLSNVADRSKQIEWAGTLMGWARQDGNVAQVFAAINTVLTPTNPATIDGGAPTGGTGGTSSYRGSEQNPPDASASDEPTGRVDASEQVPDGDVDAIVAWIHHGPDDSLDVDRARRAFVAEQERAGGPRPTVLAALVDILDVRSIPSTTEPADPAPMPLYEFVGPEGTQIDTGEWPVAPLHGADGQALYTHPETDVAGGPPMDVPADSMWAVYTGETTPFPAA